MRDALAKKFDGAVRCFRQYPGFFKLSLGSFVSKFGDGLSTVAAAWLMHTLTGSVMGVGLVFIVSEIPSLVFGPVFSAYIERLPKKKFIVAAHGLQGITQLLMAMACFYGYVSANLILLYVLVSNSLEVLSEVPTSTIGIRMVSSESDYALLNSIARACNRCAQLLGMSAAGILVGWWGMPLLLVADGLTFFFCALMTISTHIPLELHEQDAGENVDPWHVQMRTTWRDLKGGMRICLDSAPIRFCLLFGLFVNFMIGPINIIMPNLIEKAYGGDAGDYSGFLMALSVGMILGSLAFPKFYRSMPLRTILSFCLTLLGVAFIGLSLGLEIWVGMLSMIGTGFAISVVNSTISQMVVTQTPRAALARVAALLNSSMVLIDPLSKVAIAWLIDDSLFMREIGMAIEELALQTMHFRLIPGDASAITTLGLGLAILLPCMPMVYYRSRILSLQPKVANVEAGAQ